MKIYFGASISLSRELLPIYQLIVEQIVKKGHTVLSKYVVDPNLKLGEGLTAKKLFERETKTIDKVDLMIAEVTAPSWGTAFLMEHALKKGKPVVALFYKDADRDLPIMIKGHPQFYLEHYNQDNLKSVLDHFFRFLNKKAKMKGKFIVIDGTDGSGKATQAKLLEEKLRSLGKTVRHIEFPRYYSSFHGKIVGRFLKGDFGEMNTVSPYLISLAYALDRLTARKQIRDWLFAGDWVVADRYTSASMAHQAARVPKKDREEFIAWIEEMEYQQHKIPREDMVLFLYVPVTISQKLVTQKGGRKYIAGSAKDIAETSRQHQEEALGVYLELCRKKKHWVRVDCVDTEGKLLTREVVHSRVMRALQEQKIAASSK